MKFNPWSVALALSLIGTYASAQNIPSPSLCMANEDPVFSCTLKGASRKTVSLCATPSSSESAQGAMPWDFHYLFGRPGKIELRYPADGNDKNAFTFTRLRYAGATFGYAHTFINGDYKYILYSIEGTGFKRSGLLLQRQGMLHASLDMHCKSSTLVETKNSELVRMTSEWRADPDIDAHGLPSTH